MLSKKQIEGKCNDVNGCCKEKKWLNVIENDMTNEEIWKIMLNRSLGYWFPKWSRDKEVKKKIFSTSNFLIV